MPLRSMTAFAQFTGQARPDSTFTVALKSVNHRFLDLHLRMPPQSEALEIKLRRLLKEKLARGHIELTLVFDGAGAASIALNRELVRGYVQAFREAAREFGVAGEPDLNAVLRMPGALTMGESEMDADGEARVLSGLAEAIAQLERMRLEEGRGIERELRERMARLRSATAEVEKLREAVTRAYLEKIQSRMKELVGSHADRDRILQEAALLAERSDIEEEIVRLNAHIQHFLGVLGAAGAGEAGKKLDFLLQEMNREANTLLSKTSSVAGEGLRITELGLAMKAEIEKAREQVQNVE
ncbi:MAG TPA: YicC/YloC family endoribonuclease [Terriglobales bacterium]|nr:YicC/YloC family endoribonuclease [Terriglobales bacterium]